MVNTPHRLDGVVVFVQCRRSQRELVVELEAEHLGKLIIDHGRLDIVLPQHSSDDEFLVVIAEGAFEIRFNADRLDKLVDAVKLDVLVKGRVRRQGGERRWLGSRGDEGQVGIRSGCVRVAFPQEHAPFKLIGHVFDVANLLDLLRERLENVAVGAVAALDGGVALAHPQPDLVRQRQSHGLIGASDPDDHAHAEGDGPEGTGRPSRLSPPVSRTDLPPMPHRRVPLRRSSR